MRFMMIVKATQNSEAGMMPGEKILAAMARFNDELVKSGVLLDGSGLTPSSQGARLTVKAGKRTVTDGPFTETKELIAGYWLIHWPRAEFERSAARAGASVRVAGRAMFPVVRRRVET